MSALDDWDPKDLERYRAYLKVRARKLALDPRLKVRVDESDLVHEAFLRAHASKSPCEGTSHKPRMAYLDQAFDWAFQDQLRKQHAEMRDIDKEEAQQALNESTAAYQFDPADGGASPSEQVARREEHLRAVEAVNQLPEKERDVIILTHLQGLTVQETAGRLGLTVGQAAGLYGRGLTRLRGKLNPGAGAQA